MSACKSCGAPIVWAVTLTGKRMPLDEKPEKRFVLDRDGKCSLLYTYTSHFASCPQAAQHRRGHGSVARSMGKPDEHRRGRG